MSKKSVLPRLSDDYLDSKLAFIENYIEASNAAEGSLVDANANVTQKNIATLEVELWKSENIQLNRRRRYRRNKELWGQEVADRYIESLNKGWWYQHDESSMKPYCVAITQYPFLTGGTKILGGCSDPAKHLKTYAGQFVNLVYLVASQFAGAVATGEWLLYFDYFARKDFGDTYLETNLEEVHDAFSQVVYSLNDPSAARGNQTVFWNIALFDELYMEQLFEGFVFPEDFDRPNFKTTADLQVEFMNWFNHEREKEVLTFPVVTACRIYDKETGEPEDKNFDDFICDQYSRGNSFFTYQSDSVDSLSSCCRLKNELSSEDIEFSTTLGAGGMATGSVGVMSLNFNALEQDDSRTLEMELDYFYKWQYTNRTLIEDFLKAKMLPVYDAGYIALDKQFSTLGICGAVEAAEFRGHSITPNPEYKKFMTDKLKVIFASNRAATKEYGFKFNCEFVPAENLGVKFAKWDKEAGLEVPRDCYNSYLFRVEDETLDIFDKLELHGEDLTRYCDGGSACHINLDDFPTKEGYRTLLIAAAKVGSNYVTTNIPSTVCKKCGYIGKKFLSHCIACGSEDVEHATRVIGYLKKITNFSEARQLEASMRSYGTIIDVASSEPF